MAIGWASSDGTSGVHENAYEAQMADMKMAELKTPAKVEGAPSEADIASMTHTTAQNTQPNPVTEGMKGFWNEVLAPTLQDAIVDPIRSMGPPILPGMKGATKIAPKEFPEGWASVKPGDKKFYSTSDYPHVQEAFQKAVESGASTLEDIGSHMQLNGTPVTPFILRKLRDKALGVEPLLKEYTRPTAGGEKPLEVPKEKGPWKADVVDKIKEMYSQGKSSGVIADELGLTRGQVAGKLKRFQDEGTLGDKPATTESQRLAVEKRPGVLDTFKEMAAKRFSYKEIADKIGTTPEYARVLAHRYKINVEHVYK